MSDVNPARLDGWLKAVATTEDEELDCDALFEIMDKVVEMAASGQDVRSLLPGIALHLDHCPDCRDQYETLTEFWEDAPRGALRPLKRLARKGRSLLRRRPNP
jgi:predicted anti-sigma-YlaC factor YlaD